MAEYTAKFTLKLEVPIKTSEIELAELDLELNTEATIKSIKLSPVLEELNQNSIPFLSKINVEMVYSSEDLSHVTSAGNELQDGIMVTIGDNGLLFPPWDFAKGFLMPILNVLSGITGQAYIYCDIRKNLEMLVSDFTWILADGLEVPPLKMTYPKLMSYSHPRLSGNPLNASDWIQIPEILSGRKEVALWKIILARAIRETDARNIIIQCATALDVGVSPYLPLGIDKCDMDVFTGKNGKYGVSGTGKKKIITAPDLTITDPGLYATLSQLWYTRHAVVHKGEVKIYDRNPMNKNTRPLRDFNFHQDIPEFITAVPKAIEYIESNLNNGYFS